MKADVNATVVLSGFHDPCGNVAANEELAHNRMHGVGDSLEAAGIANERVQMKKPEVAAAGGAREEDRRAEGSARAEQELVWPR